MENKPIIMVVEDESGMRESITARLRADGYRVMPVKCGQDAMITASSYCPDVILLNLDLPDMGGMKVLESVRSWSAVPVIIVSSRQSDNDIVAALDGGADDYITKPFSTPVMMARVRAAMRKSTVLKSSRLMLDQTFERDGLMIDFERRVVRKDGQPLHLTPIEYRLLVLLAVNEGKVLTYRKIISEIWGPYAKDASVLRVNMANLRRKIEENPASPKYILTEVGVGYRMIEKNYSDRQT